MAQIDTLKTLLQISGTTHDTLLSAIIDQCSAEYIARTHQTDADEDITTAMCVERFNALGNEGLDSINYSGINERYFSDYSDKVKALIRSKTRMVAI